MSGRACHALCLLAAIGCRTGLGGGPELDAGVPADAGAEAPAPQRHLVRVAALAGTSCALADDGSAWCWGVRPYRSPGDETLDLRPRALDLPGSVRELRGSCAVLRDGSVRCWRYGSGCSTMGVTTGCWDQPAIDVADLPAVTGLVEGDEHWCAALPDGSARCWGRQTCAIGGLTSFVPAPAAVAVEGVLELAAGGADVCARQQDGAVRCWGDNDYGQLGNGGGACALPDRPLTIPLPPDTVQVALGTTYGCAVSGDGALRCWGRWLPCLRASWQFCTPTPLGGDGPAVVSGLPAVVQVAVQSDYLCVRTREGAVLCRGQNSFGQLGRAQPSDTGDAFLPIEGLPAVTDLALERYHACALAQDGEVYCWGRNYYGELGDGSRDGRSGAVRVTW
jgi:alpha-tubulin suppressor-like RCC1 family protein